MENPAKYVPGVCNIGRAEIRARLIVGWVALVATSGLWAAMLVLRWSPAWRWLLFIPASIAATGFLQSAWHFCATFGVLGRFNVGPKIGRTETVEQAADRQLDRRTALQILGLSLVVGLAVAAAAFSTAR